jgi:hypothetical protein
MVVKVTPIPGSKRALADMVAVQKAREEVIAQTASTYVDGCHHPFFSSNTKKIPASNWERSWLMKYFVKLSSSSELTGNYYRCVIWHC